MHRAARGRCARGGTADTPLLPPPHIEGSTRCCPTRAGDVTDAAPLHHPASERAQNGAAPRIAPQWGQRPRPGRGTGGRGGTKEGLGGGGGRGLWDGCKGRGVCVGAGAAKRRWARRKGGGGGRRHRDPLPELRCSPPPTLGTGPRRSTAIHPGSGTRTRNGTSPPPPTHTGYTGTPPPVPPGTPPIPPHRAHPQRPHRGAAPVPRPAPTNTAGAELRGSRERAGGAGGAGGPGLRLRSAPLRPAPLFPLFRFLFSTFFFSSSLSFFFFVCFFSFFLSSVFIFFIKNNNYHHHHHHHHSNMGASPVQCPPTQSAPALTRWGGRGCEVGRGLTALGGSLCVG